MPVVANGVMDHGISSNQIIFSISLLATNNPHSVSIPLCASVCVHVAQGNTLWPFSATVLRFHTALQYRYNGHVASVLAALLHEKKCHASENVLQSISSAIKRGEKRTEKSLKYSYLTFKSSTYMAFWLRSSIVVLLQYFPKM